MTNPEDNVTDNTIPKTAGDAIAENKVWGEFLERVVEIPVVNAAKEYSTAAYNQVKQLNRFTSAALSAAETTALYFAVTAKPFLEKVQPHAQILDKIACRSLDTVEEKLPFLMKSPELLVEDARKLCYSTVEMGFQKIYVIKNFSSETVHSIKDYGLQNVNDVLDLTEELINKYLPPAFNEGSPEANNQSNSIPERARKVTSKFGIRVYGHGVEQLLSVYRIGLLALEKSVHSVELLQLLKENYGNRSVQKYVDEAKMKATWIWEELNKKPAASTETDKSLEQSILSLPLARRTTSVLVHAYNVTSIPIATLHQTFREGLQTARRYTTELFSQFDQATNARKTLNVLTSTREDLAALINQFQELISVTEETSMRDDLAALINLVQELISLTEEIIIIAQRRSAAAAIEEKDS